MQRKRPFTLPALSRTASFGPCALADTWPRVVPRHHMGRQLAELDINPPMVLPSEHKGDRHPCRVVPHMARHMAESDKRSHGRRPKPKEKLSRMRKPPTTYVSSYLDLGLGKVVANKQQW